MKNKWSEFLGAGLLSVSTMFFCTSLMVTGCSSNDSSSVAGGDTEESLEEEDSDSDEGVSSSSVASKDKKAKSSSSEKNEKIESSSSEKADSSSVEEYAIKNMTLTGVAQKGPFVESIVEYRELNCKTLRITSNGYVYKGSVENGVYNLEISTRFLHVLKSVCGANI